MLQAMKLYIHTHLIHTQTHKLLELQYMNISYRFYASFSYILMDCITQARHITRSAGGTFPHLRKVGVVYSACYHNGHPKNPVLDPHGHG